jgi:hypothetical protein
MHAQLACHNSWWTVSSSDSLHVAKRCVDRTMASWHCCDGFTQPFCVLWNYFIFVMMRGLYWGNANDVKSKRESLFPLWMLTLESMWITLIPSCSQTQYSCLNDSYFPEMIACTV